MRPETGDWTGNPEDVLRDVAFRSRSASRVRILDLLTTEVCRWRENRDATGIARTTIDRIDDEFEERGWARRTTDGDTRRRQRANES